MNPVRHIILKMNTLLDNLNPGPRSSDDSFDADLTSLNTII